MSLLSFRQFSCGAKPLALVMKWGKCVDTRAVPRRCPAHTPRDACLSVRAFAISYQLLLGSSVAGMLTVTKAWQIMLLRAADLDTQTSILHYSKQTASLSAIRNIYFLIFINRHSEIIVSVPPSVRCWRQRT